MEEIGIIRKGESRGLLLPRFEPGPFWGSSGQSQASGINNSGQIIGNSTIGTTQYDNAFLYSGGVMKDLGTLGTSFTSFSIATAINDSGQVVGYSSLNNGQNHAFLYSGKAMTDLGTLGGQSSEAFAINNSGQVVGFALTSGGQSHAFVYTNGVMTDLNSLLPPGSGWTLENALAINNAGDIVGIGINPEGATDAFELSSVPEPSTLVVFIVGLSAVACRALRRSRNPVSTSVDDDVTSSLALSTTTGPNIRVDFVSPGEGGCPTREKLGRKNRGFRGRAELYTLFKIDRTRIADVLIAVLGTEFNGVPGCDSFSSYRCDLRKFDVSVQFFLAHLIREVKFLTN